MVKYNPTDLVVSKDIVTEVNVGVKYKREGYSTHPVYKTLMELYQAGLQSKGYWKIGKVLDGYQFIVNAVDMNIYNAQYYNWYFSRQVGTETSPAIFELDGSIKLPVKYMAGLLINGVSTAPQSLRVAQYFSDTETFNKVYSDFQKWAEGKLVLVSTADGLSTYRKI